MRLLGLMLALGLSGCASIPARPEVPELYHYLRTNRDGSEPEHVVHFRSDPRHIAVYKWVSKCTTAAYVTADFDPTTGEATVLYAGKVARDASQDRFGRIDFDPQSRGLTLRISGSKGEHVEQSQGTGKPWALFDYDLADLNAHLMDARPTDDFSFWWALVMPNSDSGKLLNPLGWIDARHAGIVKKAGKAVRQFDLTLRSDPSVKGHLRLDPETGAIVTADFDRPNHDNYQNFKLVLERIEPGGQAAWDRLLKSHYTDCPKND